MRSIIYASALATLLFAAPAAFAADAKQMEQNKQIVIDFYDKAINKKDFDAAKVHFGPKYIQHNPNAADGPEGLKAFIEFLKAKVPELPEHLSSACSRMAIT